MTVSPITRDTLIVSSVADYVTDGLTARGITHWRLLAAYPYDLQKLDTNLIAIGFGFDDDGREAELGSSMRERIYTVEWFVFGLDVTYASTLANAIKFRIESEQTIPLLDPSGMEIDRLIVDGVHARREPVPDPEPWQEFTWLVQARIQDYYDAAQA